MSTEQQTRREAKRERILSSALRLFARKGFGATALEEVARSSRLAKGTLYLYFKDKEDLYAQAVLAVIDRLEESIVERLERSIGAVEKLRCVAKGQILFFSQNRDYYRLFSSLFTTEAPLLHRRLLAPMLDRRRRQETYLEGLIEEGKREGVIREDVETVAIVHSFMGMVNQAAARQCRDNRTSAQADQATTGLMTILLKGVSTR